MKDSQLTHAALHNFDVAIDRGYGGKPTVALRAHTDRNLTNANRHAMRVVKLQVNFLLNRAKKNFSLA